MLSQQHNATKQPDWTVPPRERAPLKFHPKDLTATEQLQETPRYISWAGHLFLGLYWISRLLLINNHRLQQRCRQPALSYAGRSHQLLATSQSSQTRSSFAIKLCPTKLPVLDKVISMDRGKPQRDEIPGHGTGLQWHRSPNTDGANLETLQPKLPVRLREAPQRAIQSSPWQWLKKDSEESSCLKWAPKIRCPESQHRFHLPLPSDDFRCLYICTMHAVKLPRVATLLYGKTIPRFPSPSKRNPILQLFVDFCILFWSSTPHTEGEAA